jgi:hypothetical protein
MVAMDLHINIPADLSVLLLEQASSHGQNPEDYALERLRHLLKGHSQDNAAQNAASTDTFKETLGEIWKSHPNTPHTLDDSRESIYAGRGE